MINDSTQENTASRIEEIVRQSIGSETTLSLEADLSTDLGMDSLELVELGIKLEKEFTVKLPITDLRSSVTVEDLVQLVEQKKSAR